MNTTRFILSVLGAFAFIFAFEWVVHGFWLKEAYEATADLWRPMEDHKDYMPYMVASQFLQAFLIAYIFTRHYEGNGLGEGLRFGLYIGLLLAALDFGVYCYLPIELTLVGSWMGASVLKGVGSGLVLALLYRD